MRIDVIDSLREKVGRIRMGPFSCKDRDHRVAEVSSCEPKTVGLRHVLTSLDGEDNGSDAARIVRKPIQIMIQLWCYPALLSLLVCLAISSVDVSQETLVANAKHSNDSLLWGPYRPNLYFGIRPRIPKSLMTGLLWAKVDNFQGIQNSRPPVSQ